MDITQKYVVMDNCHRLDEMLARLRDEKDDAVLKGIMSAARQLCMSYDWCQNEMDSHQQAYEQARTRSQELEEQLDNMLKLVEGYSGEELMAEPPVEDAPSECRVEASPGPTLVVYCFGAFRVFQDDKLVNYWNGHKGQLILKYLVAHDGKPVSKEKLMDALWPDSDPESARRNLHQAIYSLRHTLKANNPELQYILFKNECYLLNPEVELWADFVEFEKRIRLGHTLEAQGKMASAISEYAMAEGLFLGGFLEDEPYAEWADSRRHHFQHMYLDIADKLGEYYFRQKQYTATVSQCQRILQVDNCYEPAYQMLIQCHLAQGQRHMAVRQYQACVQALRETLGLSPSEKTRQVYQRLISL